MQYTFNANLARWGREWIMIPNPAYGSFESEPFGHDFRKPAAEQRTAKRNALAARLDLARLDPVPWVMPTASPAPRGPAVGPLSGHLEAEGAGDVVPTAAQRAAIMDVVAAPESRRAMRYRCSSFRAATAA